MGEPWNSISSIGSSRSASRLWRLTARAVRASSRSQRAIGTPIWMMAIVVRTATSTLGNEPTAAATASGSGYGRSVISVKMPSVPSLPTDRRLRS